MRKSLILIFILILLLGGGFTYIYYKYEIPNKNNSITLTNLTISAEYNGKKIKTGYVIESPNGIIEGNTSQSYEFEQVRKNQVIKIYNKNIEDQLFFKDLRIIDISENLIRIDLKLEEPKPINIKKVSENPIILNLTSQDARDIDFCLDWTSAYIFVKVENYTKIEKEGYKNCFNGDFSLNESNNQVIKIDYTKFKIPTNEDYIKIILIQEELKGENDKLEIIK